MSRRYTGLGFCSLAALLYAARFLTAAIYGSSMMGWSGDNFRALLSYVDQGFTFPITLASAMGIIYLIWGELTEKAKTRS